MRSNYSPLLVRIDLVEIAGHAVASAIFSVHIPHALSSLSSNDIRLQSLPPFVARP